MLIAYRAGVFIIMTSTSVRRLFFFPPPPLRKVGERGAICTAAEGSVSRARAAQDVGVITN